MMKTAREVLREFVRDVELAYVLDLTTGHPEALSAEWFDLYVTYGNAMAVLAEPEEPFVSAEVYHNIEVKWMQALGERDGVREACRELAGWVMEMSRCHHDIAYRVETPRGKRTLDRAWRAIEEAERRVPKAVGGVGEVVCPRCELPRVVAAREDEDRRPTRMKCVVCGCVWAPVGENGKSRKGGA